MIGSPPLARGGLDRAAHRRRDQAWLDQAWPRASVLVVEDGGVVLDDLPGSAGDAPRLRIVTAADAPPEAERYFLGVDVEGLPYFAIRPGATSPSLPGTRVAGLREVGEFLPGHLAEAAVTAVALAQWHRRSGYSPRSGKPTMVAEAGWARVTADQAETLWPRTDPAVITLVHNGLPPARGGACLLATNVGWTCPRYSCLAGFVEPGESVEMAAVREIAEEVGVAAAGLRYVASQPWPLPGSLMLGFSAVADPAAELRLDPTEIADARWFTFQEISEALAGRSADFCVPLGVSIAYYLLTCWAEGRIDVTG